MSDKNKLQWLESLPGLSSLIVTEVLQMADELVFAQTGKHLDDIQKAVIQGVWQGNSYQEIAGEYNRSHSRVRDVGYRLWQILSEQLEEDVNKHNFRSTIERLYTVSPQIINVASNHNFNLCSQSIHQSKKENPLETEVNYQDLGTAPKISYFYGRTNELETLFNWTLTQNIRLAAVIGLSGIGKTTLIKRFIDLYSQSFEAIIWKSLKFPKPLISLLNDVLETFQIKNSNSNNFNQQLDKLIKFCQQKKCLIVFDDVQNLFFPGTFAGEYQNNY
ncbi:MAG: ATP-binding protein, partial [Oscillatoria sp. PMC 1076.18]|nr:ATP-binding protein [Oscillatoria sp. PMC 1076.18]